MTQQEQQREHPQFAPLYHCYSTLLNLLSLLACLHSALCALSFAATATAAAAADADATL
jgi:hypothetical protein